MAPGLRGEGGSRGGGAARGGARRIRQRARRRRFGHVHQGPEGQGCGPDAEAGHGHPLDRLTDDDAEIDCRHDTIKGWCCAPSSCASDEGSDMRLVTFGDGGGRRIGALDEAGKVLDLAAPMRRCPRHAGAIRGGARRWMRCGRRWPGAGGAGANAARAHPRPAKNIFCVARTIASMPGNSASPASTPRRGGGARGAGGVQQAAHQVIGPGEPIPSFLDPSGSTTTRARSPW